VVVADMQCWHERRSIFDQAEELSPDTVRIMLTGNADQKTAADAVIREHVFRFYKQAMFAGTVGGDTQTPA